MKVKALFLLGFFLSVQSPILLAAESKAQTVAVFPFKVLNKDPRAAHLGEGASEHIITHLVQSNAVEIVEEAQIDKAAKRIAKGQSGVFDETSALKLGRMVNARYVVIGTVQAFGLQVAINARLLEVETGKLVIAESIHGNINEIFSLYEKLAVRLKESLVNHLSLLVTSSIVAERGGTTDTVSILELIARGEKLDPAYGGTDIKGANMMYRQAVLRDPNSAAARRRLAGTFIAMQRFDEARFNLEKSLETESEHAWAQAHLGYCLHKLNDESGALVRYAKAVDLEANNNKYRFWYASSLLNTGNAEQAREQYRQVIKTEPKHEAAMRGLRRSELVLKQAAK